MLISICIDYYVQHHMYSYPRSHLALGVLSDGGGETEGYLLITSCHICLMGLYVSPPAEYLIYPLAVNAHHDPYMQASLGRLYRLHTMPAGIGQQHINHADPACLTLMGNDGQNPIAILGSISTVQSPAPCQPSTASLL